MSVGVVPLILTMFSNPISITSRHTNNQALKSHRERTADQSYQDTSMQENEVANESKIKFKDQEEKKDWVITMGRRWMNLTNKITNSIRGTPPKWAIETLTWLKGVEVITPELWSTVTLITPVELFTCNMILGTPSNLSDNNHHHQDR